jgi:hypothetical protein
MENETDPPAQLETETDPLAQFGLDAIDLRWTLKDIAAKRSLMVNKQHLAQLIELGRRDAGGCPVPHHCRAEHELGGLTAITVGWRHNASAAYAAESPMRYFGRAFNLTGQRAKRTGEPGHSSLRRPWGVVMQNADVAAAIDNASNLVVKTVRALISTAMRRYGS